MGEASGRSCTKFTNPLFRVIAYQRANDALPFCGVQRGEKIRRNYV
jgi:hypothetical protein